MKRNIYISLFVSSIIASLVSEYFNIGLFSFEGVMINTILSIIFIFIAYKITKNNF